MAFSPLINVWLGPGFLFGRNDGRPVLRLPKTRRFKSPLLETMILVLEMARKQFNGAAGKRPATPN
jgi:hypothetical protein